MEEALLELAKIGGPVVCVVIANLLYMWQRDKIFNKTLNNHIEHWTEAQKISTEWKIKQIEVMTKLCERIERCPEKN